MVKVLYCLPIQVCSLASEQFPMPIYRRFICLQNNNCIDGELAVYIKLSGV